jgi:hypothetical protein
MVFMRVQHRSPQEQRINSAFESAAIVKHCREAACNRRSPALHPSRHRTSSDTLGCPLRNLAELIASIASLLNIPGAYTNRLRLDERARRPHLQIAYLQVLASAGSSAISLTRSINRWVSVASRARPAADSSFDSDRALCSNSFSRTLRSSN